MFFIYCSFLLFLFLFLSLPMPIEGGRDFCVLCRSRASGRVGLRLVIFEEEKEDEEHEEDEEDEEDEG